MKKAILTLALMATLTATASPVKHQHNGRYHTHALPAQGLSHQHNSGVKPQAQKKKTRQPSLSLSTIKKAFKATSLDPSSIKFGHWWIGQGTKKGGLKWCGFVNGKNAYGGYTGMRLYANTTYIGHQADYWMNNYCKPVN